MLRSEWKGCLTNRFQRAMILIGNVVTTSLKNFMIRCEADDPFALHPVDHSRDQEV